MVLNISISSEAEATLNAKARAAGVDLSTYAARHLELIAANPPSLQQLGAEVNAAFIQSGMTEEELTSLLEQEKHAMRTERRELKK